MKKTISVQRTLHSAIEQRAIVRVTRRKIESGHLDAYVVASSSRFTVLLPVRERFDFDGFEIVRVQDITSVSLSPRLELYKRALRLKKSPRPRAPRLALRSMKEVLRELQARYAVIAIHREVSAPEECEIGWVEASSGDRYQMKSISPDGVVEDDSSVYCFADVTRVEFGRSYEQTLARVAGVM